MLLDSAEMEFCPGREDVMEVMKEIAATENIPLAKFSEISEVYDAEEYLVSMIITFLGQNEKNGGFDRVDYEYVSEALTSDPSIVKRSFDLIMPEEGEKKEAVLRNVAIVAEVANKEFRIDTFETDWH